MHAMAAENLQAEDDDLNIKKESSKTMSSVSQYFIQGRTLRSVATLLSVSIHVCRRLNDLRTQRSLRNHMQSGVNAILIGIVLYSKRATKDELSMVWNLSLIKLT